MFFLRLYIICRTDTEKWSGCARPKSAPFVRQAAIGSVPLSMGLPCGQLVLSVAVLAILITAPLGAIGIDRTAGRLLVQESPSDIAE